MRMYDLIDKKKKGQALSKDEITFMVEGYTQGMIPDYQMSALLMAVYFRGMNEEETLALTLAMAESGEQLDLSEIRGIKVDKHSTGGVGDKTTLVLAPMVSALGIPVAKMSGRGLGHTGGTIDKLESIQGFNTSISKNDFIHNVNTIGLAIAGQTANLAPADKKLYALRDVTATVDNLSLIASSIMSKKIASGADGIVLDVKTGTGAFMKDEQQSFELASEMVKIGDGLGRETYAVISDMNQPLGRHIGNALEVKEAIETLRGEGPDDLLELCVSLGSYMLLAAKRVEAVEEGRRLLLDTIKSGQALEQLKKLVEAQGGEAKAIDHTDLLPKASIIERIKSPISGYINNIMTEEIGVAAMLLGGGRETKESVIDPAVGIVLEKRLGDKVEKGETLAVIHANDEEKLLLAKQHYLSAYQIAQDQTKPIQLIKGFVSADGIIRH